MNNQAQQPYSLSSGPHLELEPLMREYYPYIYRLAFSILGDQAEADDAAQESFILAGRRLDGFRGESSVKTWLYSITVNVCRGFLRKRKSRRLLEITLGVFRRISSETVSPEEDTLRTETEKRLWQVVDNLDEKHRLPVILRYIHELSVPEIAQILETNAGTVHSRLHYAREKLHRMWEMEGSLITDSERTHLISQNGKSK